MNRQEFDARIREISAEKGIPAEPHVAYSLKQLQKARAEYSMLGEQINGLERALTAARERRLILQGEVNSRATDLETWLGLEAEKGNGTSRGGEKDAGGAEQRVV